MARGRRRGRSRRELGRAFNHARTRTRARGRADGLRVRALNSAGAGAGRRGWVVYGVRCTAMWTWICSCTVYCVYAACNARAGDFRGVTRAQATRCVVRACMCGSIMGTGGTQYGTVYKMHGHSGRDARRSSGSLQYIGIWRASPCAILHGSSLAFFLTRQQREERGERGGLARRYLRASGGRLR